MSLLGVHLTLWIGPTDPVPAPPWLVEALDQTVVQQRGKGPSGFQLTFKVGRSGPIDLPDFRLLRTPLLRTDVRVILMVAFGRAPRVLMDGLIGHQELAPSNEPGAATLTVTGEDVSVVLNRERRTVEHVAQDDRGIVEKLVSSYAKYGFVAEVETPDQKDSPAPADRVPVQRCTDRDYLNRLAERHGFVFYVKPGPKPGTNTAYWGPPIRSGAEQRALSINLGGETNVESLNFQYDAETPVLVRGEVQDFRLGRMSVQTSRSSRRPPFATGPALTSGLTRPRQEALGDVEGLTYSQALARAQARTDASVDEVLTAKGELNAVRYGDVLQAHGIVGVRGAGFLYDGLYSVKEVTHTIRRGEYKQSFTLTREGLGSTRQVVRV